MCTRFVYHGNDTITGFDFDIDLSVWDHKVVKEKDCFFIGILRPDGVRHSYHGVNRNGSAGTLLYVHENSKGAYRNGADCVTIADLTERFIRAELTFDEALHIVQTKRIVYAPDASMQALLSDAQGRVLIVEPGIGWRAESRRCSLMTNYSLLEPDSTEPFLVPGDDRYERAARLLNSFRADFSVTDAFSVLQAVSQDGIWATRVSFVYSAKERAVFYVENNQFDMIRRHSFS